MATIERLDPARIGDDLAGLVALLQDAVDGGASVGFLPPLSSAAAQEYWQGVVAALRQRSRVVLVAREGQSMAGTVQVDLAQPANGTHRAEVLKLIVRRDARRRGL